MSELKEVPPAADDGDASDDAELKLPEAPSWYELARNTGEDEIRDAFAAYVLDLLKAFSWDPPITWLALMDSEGSVGSHMANDIYDTLRMKNAQKTTDVGLLLFSRGGRIEPAYQIAKLCKSYAKNRFIALVPRFAKSAATLIAIGADEIHFGPLGELGPIDPQINGLPALGVLQALENLAEISERHPGSAEMLAAYLRQVLSVEQVGYCQRIGQSAVQYAERLLTLKGDKLAGAAADIAHKLVYEYKDHGFVIDAEEASRTLGSAWIRTGTAELAVAELILRNYERLDLWLRVFQKKHLVVFGDFADGVAIFDRVPRAEGGLTGR